MLRAAEDRDAARRVTLLACCHDSLCREREDEDVPVRIEVPVDLDDRDRPLQALQATCACGAPLDGEELERALTDALTELNAATAGAAPGGGSRPARRPAPAPVPAGIPVEQIRDVTLREAFSQGRYAFCVIEDRDSSYGRCVTLAIQPPPGPHIEQFAQDSFGRTARVFVDTRVARATHGEFRPEVQLLPASGLVAQPDLDRDDAVIFRGMSDREWQAARSAGQIRSLGQYNLGDSQIGRTYFSVDPAQACSYATGFAPWNLHPTFDEPGYVIAVRRPPGQRLLCDGDEVGVDGPVALDDVLEVWQARPYAIFPGLVEVGQTSYFGDPGEGWTSGSRSAPAERIGWQRIG